MYCMNQLKIGRFISSCIKHKRLSQTQLANIFGGAFFFAKAKKNKTKSNADADYLINDEDLLSIEENKLEEDNDNNKV